MHLSFARASNHLPIARLGENIAAAYSVLAPLIEDMAAAAIKAPDLVLNRDLLALKEDYYDLMIGMHLVSNAPEHRGGASEYYRALVSVPKSAHGD
jgi:hypothetical protein